MCFVVYLNIIINRVLWGDDFLNFFTTGKYEPGECIPMYK